MTEQIPLHRSLLLCLAVWAGFLTILPYVTHVFHPSFQGLTVIRDKDYGNYYSRLERVLQGHPEEAANGITPIGSGIEGMQTAGIEQVVGVLFPWTHLPAPVVAIVVTALLTILLFLLCFALFRELAFPPRWALSMTLLSFTVAFHVLSRAVHPGWSFLPAFAALISFLRFWKTPTLPWLIATSLLLGSLPYLYFWSWTYVWAVCGSIALLSVFGPNGMRLPERWRKVILLGILTLALCVPFFLHTSQLFSNPLYPEVAVRASFLYQRTVESPIRTTLLLIQLIVLLSTFRRFRREWSYLVALGFLLGITLAMHQNVLHNRVLMFASHFYPHLLLSTLIAGAWVLKDRAPILVRGIVAGIASLFLLAGAYDYAFMHRFFFPSERDFADQHLMGAVALLRNGEQETILTDANAGRLLTSWTEDGIVYTTHSRFLFLSDAEVIERYCVTEMFHPDPPLDRVIDLEYNRVLQSPERERYEEDLTREACTRVKADPKASMEKYGITHVLWNKKERPEWSIDPAVTGLAEVASGTGWTLWEVRR